MFKLCNDRNKSRASDIICPLNLMINAPCSLGYLTNILGIHREMCTNKIKKTWSGAYTGSISVSGPKAL